MWEACQRKFRASIDASSVVWKAARLKLWLLWMHQTQKTSYDIGQKAERKESGVARVFLWKVPNAQPKVHLQGHPQRGLNVTESGNRKHQTPLRHPETAGTVQFTAEMSTQSSTVGFLIEYNEAVSYIRPSVALQSDMEHHSHRYYLR